MKVKFIYLFVCIIILLSGCAADEGTKPEEETGLTAAELTPLLNTQAGIDFVASPARCESRWGDKPVRFGDSSR